MLADVRALTEKHLPAQIRAKPTWRYVAAQLKQAAQGADTADVAAALVIALALDGVKCRRITGQPIIVASDHSANLRSP